MVFDALLVLLVEHAQPVLVGLHFFVELVEALKCVGVLVLLALLLLFLQPVPPILFLAVQELLDQLQSALCGLLAEVLLEVEV